MNTEFSLRDKLKQFIISHLLKATAGNTFKYLILDDFTTSYLSHTLTMSDLVEYDIALVSKISDSRKPSPTMEAIYFISPRESNITSIINDAKKLRLYKKIYVFFTSEPKMNSTAPLSSCDLLHTFPSGQNFLSLNISFLAPEERFFSLPSAPSLTNLVTDKPVDFEQLANEICSVFKALEYPRPTVIYQKSSKVCKTLADAIAKQSFEPSNVQSSILVLVDRSFDTVTPILHGTTYRAAIFDAFEVTDHVARFVTDGKAHELVLQDPTDHMWKAYRDSFVYDAISSIDDDFERFRNSSEVKSMKLDADSKSSDIKKVLTGLGDFTKQSTMICSHENAAIALHSYFKDSTVQFHLLSALEQDLSLGKTFDDKPVNPLENPRFNAILSSLQTPFMVKLRLMLLAIHCMGGLTPETRNKFLDFVSNNRLEAAEIFNGNALIESTGGMIPNKKDKKKRRKAAIDDEVDQADLKRWQPLLNELLRQVLTGEIKMNDKFVITGDLRPPGQNSSASNNIRSIRKQPKWKESDSEKPIFTTRQKPLIMIFSLGGICQYELKPIYIPPVDGAEVIIGSDRTFTTTEYLSILQQLGVAQ